MDYLISKGEIMLKKYENLLNLDATIAKSLFEEYEHPWEVLPMIEMFILRTIPKTLPAGFFAIYILATLSFTLIASFLFLL